VEKVEITLDDTPENLTAGAETFKNTCASCHGDKGQGVASFPALNDTTWIYGSSPSDIFHVIKYGKTDKGMLSFKNSLSDEQINQVTLFILKGLNPKETADK